MLLEIEKVRKIPQFKNQGEDYLTMVLTMADAEVKKYCKRDLEETTYTEYHDGNEQTEIVLRQWPVSSVTSLFVDPGGFYGQSTGGFAAGTQLTQGSNFVLVTDTPGGNSSRGTIRRIGGAGAGFTFWFNLENYATGKLSARKAPVWPLGNGNIKVVYVAGYNAAAIPSDLQLATMMMTTYLMRVIPVGAPVQSESLGAYSYSLGTPQQGFPEFASISRLLARYREVSW